jgi:hypothetical protein
MSTVESRSPQDPEDVILRAEEATAADVREAVQRGRNAQATWSRVPAPAGSEALAEAAQSLDRAADELTDLVIREMGKPRGLRRMDPAASSDALVCRASPRCSVQAPTLSWRGTTGLTREGGTDEDLGTPQLAPLAYPPARAHRSTSRPADDGGIRFCFGERQPPRASVGSNSRARPGVVLALLWERRQILKAPGFGDLELADVLAVPVGAEANDAADVGSQATRLVRDRLDGNVSPPHTLTVPSRLIAQARGVRG